MGREPHSTSGSSAGTSQALSDDALRDASSETVFRRGKTYAASGAVDVLSEDSPPHASLTATVTGTQPYTTEVWVEDGEVAGTCDCPNAEDGWFCKHQVAVALVWRDLLAGETPEVDEAARKKVQAGAKRAQTVKDQRQALHEFLHGQQAADLAGKLMELADRDRDIARELQQWRKLGELKSAAVKPADLKPLVTEMLSPGRDFISWRESFAYTQRAEAVLPVLRQARERDAASAMTLGMHALRRTWKALEQADDSNGNIGGLCHAIGAEWVASLQAAGPQPASFGDTYLQLRLDEPFDCFDAKAVQAAMGDAALAKYRRALADRWRQAKEAMLARKAEHAAKAGARKDRLAYFDRGISYDPGLMTLEHLYLAELEQAGDVDTALIVLCTDLSDAYAHSKVVAYLEKHGRYREAFAQAEQGNKAFPDDRRLQEDLLRCYERDGWTEEALALRQRQFDHAPSVERYHQVLKAGQAAGRDVAALRSSLLSALEAREREAMANKPRAFAAQWPLRGAPTPAGVQDVSLRAEILCSEKRWAEACALVQPPAVCHTDVLHDIATHLPNAQRKQAVELLLRVFNHAMPGASSPYRDELALVEEIIQRMEAARRTQWLAGLRAEYKAKRNFVRGLPQG